MLELPEVEVLRRDLEKEVVGRKVKAVEAKSMAALPRYKNRKSFTSLLTDVKIVNVTRKGLYLLFGLDNAHTMVVDLGSGFMRKISGKEKDVPPAEIAFTLVQAGTLIYVMTGPGANFFVASTDTLAQEWPELEHLGFDPVEIPISWGLFGTLMTRHPTSVKQFLVDQHIMSGIGDAYADEILFNAGVRHDRRTDSLSSQEVRRLYRGVVETLHDAIKYRGMALPDDGYVDLYGKPGEYQPQVFRRDGKRSPRSRNFIQKVKFEGRWTYFCDTQV
jgi:formamidopyrimidine-DNA glycosylase